MAEEDLAGIKIKDSYEGLLHLSDGGLSVTPGLGEVKPVYDGQGRQTCLNLASNMLSIEGVAAGLAIDSTGNADYGFIDQGTSGTGIGLRGSTFYDGTQSSDLFVANSGDVGIGTESPLSMLSIKGNGSTKWGGIAIDGDGNFTAMGAELYLADGSLDKFTVSMWAKVTSSLPSQFALLWGSSRNSNVDDGVGMYYDPSSPSAGLHFFCGSTNSSYQRVSSVAAPNVGEWFHVACVLDVTGGIHKAYLNASGGANFGGTVLPPQWGGSAEPIYFNAAALGATHASAPFHYFPVQISDFRWYNVALTDAQIQEIVEGDWP